MGPPFPPPPASSSHFSFPPPPPLMGPPFPPPTPPPPPPSSSTSQTPLCSLLSTSDRDTHLLTQALTRELSSGRCPPPPPPPYTSASRSSSSFSETLSRCLEERAFGQNSEVFSVSRALQLQQQHQQKQKQAAAAMFSERLQQDAFLHTEQNPAQKGSPLSSTSPSPISAPKEISHESPFISSNLSANSAMSMPNPIGSQSLLAYLKPNNQDAQERIFASTIASGNTSEMSNLNSSSFFSAPIALSSQASVGAGDGKVGKKRSRVSNKAPIAVISVDASDFRAMVQQLTGIPTSPSIHPYGFCDTTFKTSAYQHPYTYTANFMNP